MSDELMELPEGWEWTSFEELAERIPNALKAGPFGSALKKSFYVPSGYKIYGQEQVINEDPHFGNYYIDETRYEELKSCAVKPGDILISLVGTIGKVLILPEEIEPGIINPRLVKLSLDRILVNNEYIRKYLESPAVRDYLSKLSHGGTMDILNLSILKTLKIPLPPLNEQKRIVAAIESLRERSQKARSALSAIPELCDKFRQSVLAAAFRGDLTADWREQNPDVEPASVLLERIRLERRQQWEESELEKFKASGKIPKDDSWKAKYKETTGKGSRQLVAEIKAQKYRITDLPENWTVVKLGEIAQLQTGYAFKSSWFANEGIRLLRGTNIVPGETRWEEVVYLPKEQASEFEEYRLNDGDIVIAMDRPIISTGLKVARLSLGDTPSLLLQRVGRFKIGADISPDFLLGFLNSQLFIAHVQDQATGTQLPHISANDIESAIIPLPPIAEQQEISKLLRVWMQKSSNFTDLVDRIFPAFERIDRSILTKAFRGELVEQDPNDEPASMLLERIRAEREQQTQGKAKKPGKKEQRTIKAE